MFDFQDKKNRYKMTAAALFTAAANRVQRMFSDYLLNLGVFRGSVEPDLQPSGFFQYIYLVIKLRHLSSLFSN